MSQSASKVFKRRCDIYFFVLTAGAVITCGAMKAVGDPAAANVPNVQPPPTTHTETTGEITVPMVTSTTASAASASTNENWTTTDGVIHRNVQIVKLGSDSVTITESKTIPFSALSPDLQQRFGFVPPAKIDPMQVVASWTSITTSYGKVIPITKVTAVDVRSVHYETPDGVGTIQIADLPDDVQKSLNYDPTKAAAATILEQQREAAIDAEDQKVAQEQAKEQAAQAQTDMKNVQSGTSSAKAQQIADLKAQLAVLQANITQEQSFANQNHGKGAPSNQELAQRAALTRAISALGGIPHD